MDALKSRRGGSTRRLRMCDGTGPDGWLGPSRVAGGSHEGRRADGRHQLPGGIDGGGIRPGGPNAAQGEGRASNCASGLLGAFIAGTVLIRRQSLGLYPAAAPAASAAPAAPS